MTLPKTASAAAWLVALSLAAAGVASPAAKDNPEGDSAPVALNVAAVDSHGQPVSGLRAEDFQILDNGKPRKVVWLRDLSHAITANKGQAPATFILIDLYNSDLEARGLTANEVVRTLEASRFRRQCLPLSTDARGDNCAGSRSRFSSG